MKTRWGQIVLRGAPWLAALAALWGALVADLGPSDPARTQLALNSLEYPQFEGVRLLVCAWADSDPRVGQIQISKRRNLHNEIFPVEEDVPGFLHPVPRLAVYADLSRRTQTLARVLAAIAQAESQNLAAPLYIDTDVRLLQLRMWSSFDVGNISGALVLPLGPPAAAQRLQSPEGLGFRPVSELGLAGSLLVSGGAQDIETAHGLWRAGRRSLPWLEPVTPESQDGAEPYFEFHATLAINPQGHRGVDMLLRGVLWRYFGEHVHFIHASSGLCFLADRARQADIRGLLSDPRLIRLAQSLAEGPYHMCASARRAALTGDDAFLADFAASTLRISRYESQELADLPAELLEAWPPRASAHPQQARQLAPVLAVFERAPAAVAARSVDRIAQCAAEIDSLAELVAEALSHTDARVRASGQTACLQRLPRFVLNNTSVANAILTWPAAERKVFIAALADRLQEELRQGDPLRAVDVLSTALQSCARVWPDSAGSRVVELAAVVLVDDGQYRPRLRDATPGAFLVLAAEELLRDSDPEIRRTGWLVLNKNDPSWIFTRAAITGDPYLEDLDAQARAKSAPGPSR